MCCLAFGFCRRIDVYLIITFACLYTVRQSQSEKSCTPLLWREDLDLCFQVLCFQWLGGGTDCCKPDNITEQSNNLLHCNYSSVQPWTTTGCSHCHVCTLVSWKLLQHALMFWLSRELAEYTVCFQTHSTIRRRIFVSWIQALNLQTSATSSTSTQRTYPPWLVTIIFSTYLVLLQ